MLAEIGVMRKRAGVAYRVQTRTAWGSISTRQGDPLTQSERLSKLMMSASPRRSLTRQPLPKGTTSSMRPWWRPLVQIRTALGRIDQPTR